MKNHSDVIQLISTFNNILVPSFAKVQQQSMQTTYFIIPLSLKPVFILFQNNKHLHQRKGCISGNKFLFIKLLTLLLYCSNFPVDFDAIVNGKSKMQYCTFSYNNRNIHKSRGENYRILKQFRNQPVFPQVKHNLLQ